MNVSKIKVGDTTYDLKDSSARVDTANLKSVKVEGSGVLSGGGTLTLNRTIVHNTADILAGTYGAYTDTVDGSLIFSVPAITVDTYGHVTEVSTGSFTNMAESGKMVTSYIINQTEVSDGVYKLPEDMIELHTASMNSIDMSYVNGELEYNDIIKRIRAHSHIYVGQYDTTSNKLLVKLVDDSDKTKYADGTTIVLTDEQDLFMKLPQFWWKCEELSEDRYKISFCMNQGYVDNTWNEWEGNDFIGVYEGLIVTTQEDETDVMKLYSKPGVTPTVNKSWTDFTVAARKRYNNNNYRCVTYEAHRMMCLLGYGWFGTTDDQSIVGKGTSSYPKTTGLCDSKGMSDSSANIDGNSTSINFWGLENWWGNIYEFIDNIKTNGSSYGVNVLGADRSTVSRSIVTGFSGNDGEIKKMTLGPNGDVTPKLIVSNSNYNRGFTAYGFVYGGSGFVATRSGYGSYLAGGLGCFNAYYGTSNVYAVIGSRLHYKGNYQIVDSF